MGMATLGALGLSAVSPHAAQAQELVQNGGFETGDFTDWTVNSPNGDTFVLPLDAHSGTYAAIFGDMTGDGTITQNIATTPGGSYNFSFYLHTVGVSPNDFSASFDGKQVFTETDAPGDATYNQYSYTVTASGSSTPIVFSGKDPTGSINLDDVSVTPASVSVAPEPSAVATVGIIALLTAGLMLRACKRKAHEMPAA
jgi:hypothetical protein